MAPNKLDVIIYDVTPATTGVAVPVRVVDEPIQIDELAEVTATVGTGCTVTVVDTDVAAHGADVSVKVYVVFPFGLTYVELTVNGLVGAVVLAAYTSEPAVG